MTNDFVDPAIPLDFTSLGAHLGLTRLYRVHQKRPDMIVRDCIISQPIVMIWIEPMVSYFILQHSYRLNKPVANSPRINLVFEFLTGDAV